MNYLEIQSMKKSVKKISGNTPILELSLNHKNSQMVKTFSKLFEMLNQWNFYSFDNGRDISHVLGI